MCDAGAHLLAMTTARGPDMASCGAGSWGQLSRSDIAGALAMGRLHAGACYLAQAKFCDDTTVLPQLCTEVYRHALTLADQAGVSGTAGAQMWRNHARLAVCEVVGSARCPQCRGIGVCGKVLCCACAGSGELRMTERTIASALGIPKTSWRRNWQPVYRRLLADLECWSGWALSHVYKYSR